MIIIKINWFLFSIRKSDEIMITVYGEKSKRTRIALAK